MTLESILLGIIGFILAGVIGWWRGRSTGKSDAQQAEKVKDYERVKDNIQKRERADSESRGNADDKRTAAERLRDEFGRD